MDKDRLRRLRIPLDLEDALRGALQVPPPEKEGGPEEEGGGANDSEPLSSEGGSQHAKPGEARAPRRRRPRGSAPG